MFKIKNGQILSLITYTNKNQKIRLVKLDNGEIKKVIYEGLAGVIPFNVVVNEVNDAEFCGIIAENNVLVIGITKIKKEGDI